MQCLICLKNYKPYIRLPDGINLIKICPRCYMMLWLDAYNPTGSDEQRFILGAIAERPILVELDDFFKEVK